MVAQSTAPATKSSPASALSQAASEACVARAQLSKQRACYEIQLQNPRGTWLQLHSCRSLHKHARTNLARGRSFASVGARSGLGLTGARERSKSLKIVRLPRNLAPGRTGFLVCGRGGGRGVHPLCTASTHAKEPRMRGGGGVGGGW